jgi:hypothetical protein
MAADQILQFPLCDRDVVVSLMPQSDALAVSSGQLTAQAVNLMVEAAQALFNIGFLFGKLSLFRVKNGDRALKLTLQATPLNL